MRRLTILAAALVLLSPVAAAAQTRIILRCTVTAPTLFFGVFTGLRVDSAGSVSVDCNGLGNNNVVTVALSEGGSNSFLNRFMFNDNHTLNYNLYIDAAHTIIWGNGRGETQLKVLSFDFGLIGSQTRGSTIFARIPAQPTPPAGHYADRILVTVVF